MELPKSKIRLAILSPSRDAYSETFIQAHREIPGMDIRFYYQGFLPSRLEGKGDLINHSLASKVQRKLYKGVLSVSEQALASSFKKEGIQCVLAEYGPTAVVTLSVCETLKIPLVVHFLGYDASVYEVLEKNKQGYLRVFEYASSIIAVSHTMKRKLIELGCPQEKILYAPCGPNPSFFHNRPTYENKTLIGVGRFVDKKAPYYNILAFSKVLHKHPDAKLIIAGEGELFNTCKNLVGYLGVGNNVCLPGAVTSVEMQNYFADARAFVQHSITALNGDMEGTPVAVLEASAAGLPVVATRHAGIVDVVIHNETGLLCEEHDVAAMAENMGKILSNVELARELGMAGRHYVQENFSLDHHLSKLAMALQNAVNN